MSMDFRIRAYDLEKLQHCAYKGQAKKLSSERGMGGEVVEVFTGLHRTYIMGTVEYGFLGHDGAIHMMEVDEESKYDRRNKLKPV